MALVPRNQIMQQVTGAQNRPTVLIEDHLCLSERMTVTQVPFLPNIEVPFQNVKNLNTDTLLITVLNSSVRVLF